MRTVWRSDPGVQRHGLAEARTVRGTRENTARMSHQSHGDQGVDNENRTSCVKVSEAALGLDKLLVTLQHSVTRTTGLWGCKAHGKRGGQDTGPFNDRCREEGRVLRGFVSGFASQDQPDSKGLH